MSSDMSLNERVCIQYSDKEQKSLEDINKRIQQEICRDTIEKLSDTNLIPIYQTCESVKKMIHRFKESSEKLNIDSTLTDKLIDELFLDMFVPPGTKGVIRGNMFNTIVKIKLMTFDLDANRYEIATEKKCPFHDTSEIPDWYIHDSVTNKIIIGMNQVDLWRGGAQLNRALKYLNNTHDNKFVKTVCVVCNEKVFTKTTSKAYACFQVGFKNNTLCYLNNLQTIITSFFNEDIEVSH